MKKLFFISILASWFMPLSHGSPAELALFSAKWTPFQFRGLVPPILVPLALFDEGTPVYGIDLTLEGFQQKVYGLSCGLLSGHLIHCGLGIALVHGGSHNCGLVCAAVTDFRCNDGVVIGILNFNHEIERPPIYPAKPDNILQIGLFNHAQNGLQIGLINYNPNALIPGTILFNYSPRPERKVEYSAPGETSSEKNR